MVVTIPAEGASRLCFSWTSPSSLNCCPLGQAGDTTLCSSVHWGTLPAGAAEQAQLLADQSHSESDVQASLQLLEQQR